MKPYGRRLYREARHGEKAGFTQLDHAFFSVYKPLIISLL